MTAGNTQLKHVFGYIKVAGISDDSVPQVGDTLTRYVNVNGTIKGLPLGEKMDYNYQVYAHFLEHFHDRDALGRSVRNPIAMKLGFGIFIPMFIFNLFKFFWKVSPETKKKKWHKSFILFVNILPLIAIIIGGNIAWSTITSANLYTDSNGKRGLYDETKKKLVEPSGMSDMEQWRYYASKLTIVGSIKPGLNILRQPNFVQPWTKLFTDIIPLTLINYMEAYSVARRMALERNELHLLSPTQELYALGLGNLLGSVATSYPVTGSYSRSALNHAAGARTPLSMLISMSIVLLALGVLTQSFYYIPNAALGAVVWVALYNLISFQDFYDSWKYSKKDFFVLTVSFIFTLVLDTSTGLAIGIGSSFMVYIYELIFGKSSAPKVQQTEVLNVESVEGIQVIEFNGDLTFFQAPTIQDFFTQQFASQPKIADIEGSKQEYYFALISQTLDKYLLRKRKLRNVDDYIAFVYILDFKSVLFIDLSGLIVLVESLRIGRSTGVKFFFINLRDDVAATMRKFGIVADFENMEEVENYAFQRNEIVV